MTKPSSRPATWNWIAAVVRPGDGAFRGPTHLMLRPKSMESHFWAVLSKCVRALPTRTVAVSNLPVRDFAAMFGFDVAAVEQTRVATRPAKAASPSMLASARPRALTERAACSTLAFPAELQQSRLARMPPGSL